MPRILQGPEKEIIESALAESRGKVAGADGAAAKLGIPPSTLDSKIKRSESRKTISRRLPNSDGGRIRRPAVCHSRRLNSLPVKRRRRKPHGRNAGMSTWVDL